MVCSASKASAKVKDGAAESTVAGKRSRIADSIADASVADGRPAAIADSHPINPDVASWREPLGLPAERCAGAPSGDDLLADLCSFCLFPKLAALTWFHGMEEPSDYETLKNDLCILCMRTRLRTHLGNVSIDRIKSEPSMFGNFHRARSEMITTICRLRGHFGEPFASGDIVDPELIRALARDVTVRQDEVEGSS